MVFPFLDVLASLHTVTTSIEFVKNDHCKASVLYIAFLPKTLGLPQSTHECLVFVEILLSKIYHDYALNVCPFLTKTFLQICFEYIVVVCITWKESAVLD